jgi:hypothetical protein
LFDMIMAPGTGADAIIANQLGKNVRVGNADPAENGNDYTVIELQVGYPWIHLNPLYPEAYNHMESYFSTIGQHDKTGIEPDRYNPIDAFLPIWEWWLWPARRNNANMFGMPGINAANPRSPLDQILEQDPTFIIIEAAAMTQRPSFSQLGDPPSTQGWLDLKYNVVNGAIQASMTEGAHYYSEPAALEAIVNKILTTCPDCDILLVKNYEWKHYPFFALGKKMIEDAGITEIWATTAGLPGEPVITFELDLDNGDALSFIMASAVIDLGFGTRENPLPFPFYIHHTENDAEAPYIDALRAKVDDLAAGNNVAGKTLAVYDHQQFLIDLNSGNLRYQGETFTSTDITADNFLYYPFQLGFDLLNPLGRAVVARRMIEAINTTYGANIPKPNINDWLKNKTWKTQFVSNPDLEQYKKFRYKRGLR